MESATSVTRILNEDQPPIVVMDGAAAVTQIMEENPPIVEVAVKEALTLNPQISEEELESFLINYFEDEILKTLEQIKLHTGTYLQAQNRFRFKRIKKIYRKEEKSKQLRRNNIIKFIRELKYESFIEQYNPFYDVDNPILIPNSYKLGTKLTNGYEYLYDDKEFLNLSEINILEDRLSRNYQISKIDITHIYRSVDSLIKKEAIFKDINKENVVKSVYNLLNEVPENETNISDDELKDRIEKIMLIESMSNILSDLTLDERNEFDEASKRGKFF